MKLIFNIDYFTSPGEEISVDILSPQPSVLTMKPTGDHTWSATAAITGNDPVEYRYIVKRDGETVRSEWGKPHKAARVATSTTVELYDRWQDMPGDKPYYSQAFTNCINRRDNKAEQLAPRTGHLLITAGVPMVAPDETVILTGSCPALGDWDVNNGIEMSDALFPLWQAEIALKELPLDFEYKMVIVKKADREIVRWEDGANRYLSTRRYNSRHAVTESGLLFAQWNLSWRGAGVAIPVFSLRSTEDCGVGDFYDLMKMVDWAVATGQKFVQILPINDTTMTGTWTDSYPYNANSTFALHPMYLRLDAMGQLNDPERRDYYKAVAAELNSLKEIDYERATRIKIAYTRELFAQEGHKVIDGKEFKDFYAANESWLRPYAAFCVLRDIYSTPSFEKWEKYAVYDPATIDAFIESHIKDIEFVYFQQFNLDKQLRHVSEYARAKGVAIKGDIPIGISRTSVDAWTSPRLFNLGCQAGAPPDDFSVLGQNWGFPTYNWEEMSRDGFAWWKARFSKMAEYCDAYRIDHVLGFFRIWQIPMDAIHGLLGYFNPALPLTPDEMAHNYDFHFDGDIYTHPIIMDYMLRDFFGEFADEAKATFLDDAGWGRYRLKPSFATQRQVAGYFAGLEKNDKNTRLCNALMGLIDDVLFIEDPVAKGHYHPRIAAQYTYVYRSLSDYQRWCFDRLYNDFFYHRHDEFWYHKAMWKLPPLIEATGMLTCAEDLGMIPHCVPEVIHRLEILSLEIQRMPKDPSVKFGDPATYPYYSVCTTSTHDMGGIRQWWEEDREATQVFYNTMLHEHGAAPYFAEPWVCERIVDMHLKSPSMLCILPLQDWLSTDGKVRRENPLEEQINVPADSRHYWRYRMHLTLEELLDNKQLNDHLRALIKGSGR